MTIDDYDRQIDAQIAAANEAEQKHRRELGQMLADELGRQGHGYLPGMSPEERAAREDAELTERLRRIGRGEKP